MALGNGLIVQGWATGTTTNGGGFDPTSANFATDLTTDSNTANTSAPVVSSATYNFVVGDVGAWLFVQSGTNWTPGWYQIASVASNKATLTAGVGTAVLYGTSSTALNFHRPNGLNTVAGCSTVGTPTGGVWSVDYSQQTSSLFSFTDMVIGADTTQFTSVGHPVTAAMVGNLINVTSGTGFTVQRVQITAYTAIGLIATCDKSLGTTASTGGNGTLGGAIGSTSAITALTLPLVAGNKVYIKNTNTGSPSVSYTLTSTTTVTAAAKGDITNGRISVEGFLSYPGDRGGRPVIYSATNSVVLITVNDNDYWEFIHLNFTHRAATRGNGFSAVTSASTPFSWIDCVFDGCLSAITGVTTFVTFSLEGCEVTGCTSSTAAIICAGNQVNLYGCDIHDNTGDGIRNTTGNSTAFNVQNCIFDTNAIGVNDVTTSTSATITVHGSLFVDNVSDGLKIAATSNVFTLELDSNVFYNNGTGGTGYGVNNLDEQAGADANVRINRSNAYGANATGARNALTGGVGDVALTADPFADRTNRNFSPNEVSGGGLLIRGAAFPTTFPSGTTNSYRDSGPVQHRDVKIIQTSQPVFIQPFRAMAYG